MADATGKSEQAFRTIGELASELDVPQHILRYWETKFPQLKPLQRAGNRRYYRPADVALAYRIHQLLNEEGYTVRGVQKLLRSKAAGEEQQAPPAEEAQRPQVLVRRSMAGQGPIDIERLKGLRDQLAAALEG